MGSSVCFVVVWLKSCILHRLERQNPASGKLKPRMSNKERFHCVNPEINLSLYPALKVSPTFRIYVIVFVKLCFPYTDQQMWCWSYIANECCRLQDWLPCNHEYHICDYKTIRQTQDHIDFSATLRMTISTIEEVQQWVKDSTITWRIDRTRPPKGQRVIFKVCLPYIVMLGILLGHRAILICIAVKFSWIMIS